ncbi:hypothetical protein Q5P01_018465 [Channa striata]|uniref:Uncharacterized protein n=1 Tax=Channa striata TaxID=64152 RepID=A0AA88M4Y3_CHASR|nr:hypothetical protein Q5P01_018465 [Channa striata]
MSGFHGPGLAVVPLLLHREFPGPFSLGSEDVVNILAGLLDQAEAPGAAMTSSTASGPRDFNTFVFLAISVK